MQHRSVCFASSERKTKHTSEMKSRRKLSGSVCSVKALSIHGMAPTQALLPQLPPTMEMGMKAFQRYVLQRHWDGCDRVASVQ